VTHLSGVTEKGTGTVKYQPKLHSQGNVLNVISNIFIFYFFLFLTLVNSEEFEVRNNSHVTHQIYVHWSSMLLTGCTNPDICFIEC